MNKLTKSILKKNNSRDKAISDENQEIYTNMVVYLRGSDLTEYNQELVREDIIELILDGQQRGDNIQKVLGGNYKEICDEIIDAMPKKTRKEKIVEFVTSSLEVLWILGLLAIFDTLILISIYLDTVVLNIPLIIAAIVTLLTFITSKIINSKIC